jgi:hypothetical protein
MLPTMVLAISLPVMSIASKPAWLLVDRLSTEAPALSR